MLLQPSDCLRLGLSFRGENYFRLQIDNQIQIKGFQNDPESFPVSQSVLVTVNHIPDTVIRVGGVVQGRLLWSPRMCLGRAGAVISTTSASSTLQGHHLSGVGGRVPGRKERAARWCVGVQSPIPGSRAAPIAVDNDRVRVSIGAGHPDLDGPKARARVAPGRHPPAAAGHRQKGAGAVAGLRAGVNVVCDEIADDTDPVTGKPDPATRAARKPAVSQAGRASVGCCPLVLTCDGGSNTFDEPSLWPGRSPPRSRSRR